MKTSKKNEMTGSAFPRLYYAHGESCGHPKCKKHEDQPCERCGRYGASYYVSIPDYEYLLHRVLDREKLLPVLMGIHPILDDMVKKRLKGEDTC